MSHTEPGNECPECNTKLFGRRCMACGWNMSAAKDDGTPRYDCNRCDECGGKSTGCVRELEHADPRNLCPACHFKFRIVPAASNADDVCDAKECAGTAPHKVNRHVREFAAHMARIEERISSWKKGPPVETLNRDLRIWSTR